METKVKKSIMKPLRYISNIFDGKEGEEQEMQIGFPTDVKQIAHIGWDGPALSNNAARPSWDYHSAPLKSASFRSDQEEAPAASKSNPWASQVQDGLEDTHAPPTRRSRRHRSRGSSVSSVDTNNDEWSEKKEKKEKKGVRGKNRKKDKDEPPAVPEKSNRRKSKLASASDACPPAAGPSRFIHAHPNDPTPEEAF